MNLGKNVYKPISFWGWNGDMREDEIRWQIEEFKEKGFGGFFMHARAGRLLSYLGEDWFGACAVAIEEAEKQGLDVWLYDEDGWPSGFAGGIVNGMGEAYLAKQLRFSTGYPKEEDTFVLAVYRHMPDGTYIKIENNMGSEEDLYCFYRLVPHYVDIMDRNTIAAFIKVTHEEYRKQFGKYFGTVIKGIFTDEPQLPEGPCWSEGIEEKYRSKYGEDILEDLWLLQIDGAGCEKLRYRFYLCVNELINENFVCQINNWCKEQGLLMTGHFAYEDGLNDQVYANAGVMSLYKNMGFPGIDHLGNRHACSVLMKQVTSVAHQRNIPYVLSESFGCAGWETSFKELLGIAGWQAVFGVNTLCTHLSSYTMTGRRKRDYPLFFSYQEPWWEDTKLLFHAIAKLNRTIGNGKRDTKVAVIHPIRSAWCMNSAKRRYEAKFLSARFRELVNHLLDLHIDFDLLDEGDVATYLGQYSVVIMPQAITVDEDTVCALETHVKQGGKVLFIDGRPQSVGGDFLHPLVKVMEDIPGDEVQNTRGMLQKYFRAYPVSKEFRLLDSRMENEVSGLVTYYGKTEEGAILYVFNTQSGHRIRTILCHQGKCAVEKILLTDEQTEKLPSSFNGQETYTFIEVEEGSGVLLRLTCGGEAELPAKKYELQPMEMVSVKPMEENSLTLDMGRVSVNGSAFSPRKAIIHMLDEIYAQIAGRKETSKVSIEYTFFADFKHMPKSLSLAVEKMDILTIHLNGSPVTEELGWWIDKGIIRYDISALVVNGKNTVILTYEIPSTEETNTLKGKFESERNRFFYKVEPESIYICGDFDVRCNMPVRNYITHYMVSCTAEDEQVFTLTDNTEKQVADITPQGMWFYRGALEYAGTLFYDGNGRRMISMETLHCVNRKVYVNGNYAGIILGAEELDITGYLKKGINEILIVAAGHNRNLLGPHHHIHGKVYFVGQHTFLGVKGFEDFVNPDILTDSTWTDSYSFVPFDVGTVMVKSVEN